MISAHSYGFSKGFLEENPPQSLNEVTNFSQEILKMIQHVTCLVRYYEIIFVIYLERNSLSKAGLLSHSFGSQYHLTSDV